MTDRDPHTPRHGRPPGPPYGQNPYGTGPSPYGTGPYGTGPYGQNPYPSGPQGQHPYGQPPYGQDPYSRQHPYSHQPPGPPRPQPQQPYVPPLYRPEEGVPGAGFALPDEYRHDDRHPGEQGPGEPERPNRRLNVPAPIRILASVVVLLVGTGVAAGLPFRTQLQQYDKHRTATLSYKEVPKGAKATLAGIVFLADSVTKDNDALNINVPPGTTAVKVLIGSRSPNQNVEYKLSELEFVFRDAQGRTWSALQEPAQPEKKTAKGIVEIVKVTARVPTAVAGQVRPVVRPTQAPDPSRDPTLIPKGPALEFAH